MRNPRLTWIATGAALVTLALSIGAHAQSADAIIDKLVEKGILTVEEGQELRKEADDDFSTAYQIKTGSPSWVKSLTIGGDVRGRFEGFYAKNPNFADRNRFRYRLRFGATALLKDNFEVGLRLGSGNFKGVDDLQVGVNPISNNQTIGNNAAKKNVFIDLVYAKWSPLRTAQWDGHLTIGKMHSPFKLSNMIFDGDYTPEGGAVQFVHRVDDRHALGLNAGGFILDEISQQSNDPYLLGAQLRLDSRWSDKVSTGIGVTGFLINDTEHLKNSDVPNINAGNSRNDVGELLVDFNPIVVDAAFTYALDGFGAYKSSFPITIGGEYMVNPATDDRNQGYWVGITFGKAGKKGLWDVSYRWKHLEGDAWYEEFVDSNFGAYYAVAPVGAGFSSGYAAGTNARGHIVRVRYSPYDSLTLSIKTFITQLIDVPPPLATDPDLDTVSDMVRLQVDAAWKF